MTDSPYTVNGISRDEILKAKQAWLEAREKEGVEGVYKAQAIQLPLPPILHDSLRVPRAERAVIGVLDRKRFVLDGGDASDWKPAERAKRLAELGCTAVVVCADECAHDGTYHDILAVAQEIELPIISGDYVLDSVQVTMARAHGAAAVILSASLLSERALKKLYRQAVRLQLDVIIDVAAAKHVEAAKKIRVGQGPTGVPRLFGADILSFSEPDVRRLHERVAPAIPEEALSVARITGQEEFDATALEEYGYEAFIVDGSTHDIEAVTGHVQKIAGERGAFAMEATNAQ
jgi:indole-3-glycerol phosphate synthase